jgi:CDP-diacylglycerol--glycerol-3-phosphate 3-phosphatidyltransferase
MPPGPREHEDPPAGGVDDGASARREFAALRASGDKVGMSKGIGLGFAGARDVVARVLLRLGATPNRLTLAGLGFSCAAGYCLARGASQQVPYFVVGEGPVGWWPAIAGLFLLLAGACDMLDGAVARLGGLGSQAGAVLDSCVDRFSDMAIYLGCLVHFASGEQANVTFQLLAVVTLANAFLISYIKARAENLIADCTVGYWLRGERCAAILIGCAVGHVPTVLWQLAVSGAFTVWRRLTYAYAAIRAQETGGMLPVVGPSPGWRGWLQLWRHPRGSVAYDFVTGAHIAFIIVGPWIWPFLLAVGAHADPFARWLAGGGLIDN